MLPLPQIAHLLGGNISNGQILCPGPNHSPGDRSLSVKPDATAPDGYLYHSFAGDDPGTCREFIKAKIGHLLPLKTDQAEIAEKPPAQAILATSDEGLSDATLKNFKGKKPDRIDHYRDASGGGILQAIARWNNWSAPREVVHVLGLFYPSIWRIKR